MACGTGSMVCWGLHRSRRTLVNRSVLLVGELVLAPLGSPLGLRLSFDFLDKGVPENSVFLHDAFVFFEELAGREVPVAEELPDLIVLGDVAPEGSLHRLLDVDDSEAVVSLLQLDYQLSVSQKELLESLHEVLVFALAVLACFTDSPLLLELSALF